MNKIRAINNIANRILVTMILISWPICFYAQTSSSSGMVIYNGNSRYAFPVLSFDSIYFPDNSPLTAVKITGKAQPIILYCDSLKPCVLSDTLYIIYNSDNVDVYNPRIDLIDIDVEEGSSNVKVTSTGLPNLVISATGSCDDGSLAVSADTTYTLLLNNLSIRSSKGPAFYSETSQKMKVLLAEGTDNRFEDSPSYSQECKDINGCFCSMGRLDFIGAGNLYVTGYKKHAIYSKKAIRFKEGNISVESAPSDAVHSGKYVTVDGANLNLQGMEQDGIDADEYVEIIDGSVCISVQTDDTKAIKCGEDFIMSGGTLSMNLHGDITKGIKAKRNIAIEGGMINGEASGNVMLDGGSPSYCIFVKSDNNCVISGGTINLIHNGISGKCISCDNDLYIEGGTLNLETHGDGGKYVNAEGEDDFYTAKCIDTKDSLIIEGGEIKCVSTGIGGKGIVSDNFAIIGNPLDVENQSLPKINVETTNTCIVNNVDEDKRFGCPKAIKIANTLDIFGGEIYCSTHGMGGGRHRSLRNVCA